MLSSASDRAEQESTPQSTYVAVLIEMIHTAMNVLPKDQKRKMSAADARLCQAECT